MSENSIPPPAQGGLPAKYPQLIKDLQIGQFVSGLKSSSEQIGCYKAALRYGKYAVIRTVNGDRRVYIVSRATFEENKKRKTKGGNHE